MDSDSPPSCLVCEREVVRLAKQRHNPIPKSVKGSLCESCVKSYDAFRRSPKNDQTPMAAIRWASSRARAFERIRLKKRAANMSRQWLVE